MKIRLRKKFTSKIIFYQRKYPDLQYTKLIKILHKNNNYALASLNFQRQIVLLAYSMICSICTKSMTTFAKKFKIDI